MEIVHNKSYYKAHNNKYMLTREQKAIKVLNERGFEVINIKRKDFIVKDEVINDYLTTAEMIEYANEQKQEIE